MKRPLLFILLHSILTYAAVAQTCTIINNDTNVCQGTSITFNINTSGGTATGYAWNFGNGFTASTSTPTHTYTTAGTFTPTVTVTFAGGATCIANGKPIKVSGNPIASFNITTSRIMCFKDNELCIQDLSTPGPSNAPIVKRVYQLSNGYLQIDFPPYSSQICYEDVSDVGGHLFSLVMEVTDSNNCVGKFQKQDSVLLYPKLEKLDYRPLVTENCGNTVVQFTNISEMPTARVKKFKWVFGDGSVDSMNWASTNHTYTTPGSVSYPILIVEDLNGCIDTVQARTVVTVMNPRKNMGFLTARNQCFNGNEFKIASANHFSYAFNWSVTNIATSDPVVFAQKSNGVDSNEIYFKVNRCGEYKVSLELRRGNCVITIDTTINVFGPQAVMKTDKYKIVNGKQCTIKDTVHFVSPSPYLSCLYQNGGGLKHLWDFDDAFAPQCTVDTRKGINLGMNCNFSRDSAFVGHLYPPTPEKCYRPKLFMVDTVLGCADSIRSDLALGRPDAGPAPTATPPRKGLIIGDSIYCFGDAVTFFFDIFPYCSYTKAYINLDSACGPGNWLFADSSDKFTYTHVYTRTCNPNGYVTIGLVIANGSDSTGNICYDTAWYHHVIQLSPINPRFKLNRKTDCKPFVVDFIPEDSIQYNLAEAFWSLRAGSLPERDTFMQLFGPTDSIILSRTATYEEPGVYTAYTVFENVKGCFQTSFINFGLGFKMGFKSPKQIACANIESLLVNDVFYYSGMYAGGRYPVNFWGDKNRAANGKEQIWWDIGDGNGFAYTGDSLKVAYTKPGKYTIKMVAKDSSGCFDTIVMPDFFTVIGIEANIAKITQSYYCAPQIVLFSDSSMVFDTVPVTGPSTVDSIVSWQWDFGDQTLESYLKNAGHNYTSNGAFLVRLIATSAVGCMDTAFAQVDIAGPAPKFDIVDTLGCAPFTAVFNNTTGKQLKSWTWYFGDPTNQTLTTLNDTAVTFTYTEPGVYAVKLLASQDVTNPTTGNVTNCNSFFPDEVTGLPVRMVRVLPTPPVGLEMNDTFCTGEEAEFVSHSDSTYTKFVWRISNGDSVMMDAPDSVSTYIFPSTGEYIVTLQSLFNTYSPCLASADTTVTVIGVDAEFEIDSSKSPSFVFNNKSRGAVRYSWDFGQPMAGTANNSTETNPTHHFGPDTGSYIVCLTSFNEMDCWDSTCKEVSISKVYVEIPNVYTPGNADGYNDAFDIDIVGAIEYHLVIYNRWGAKVFESDRDGVGNDGINWNGYNQQDGKECPAGTYYFLFQYQLYTEKEPQTVHGTVTLIRN